MLRENWYPPNAHMNIVSSNGGLGDMIARTPAVRHLIKNYPHVSATIYWEDYFYELAQVLMPDHAKYILEHKKLSDASYHMRNVVTFDPNRVTSLSLNLTTQAFLILMDQLPPSREAEQAKCNLIAPGSLAKAKHPASYPIPAQMGLPPALWAPLATPYIVFTTDSTAPARAWPAFCINKLARLVRKANLVPVLLGTDKPMTTGLPGDNINPKAASGLKAELFVDLRGKTTLVEALGVIQRSKAVVGIDNGLLHLAHCTDVPIVMGFTTLLPEHRLPVREAGLTEVLEAQVPCNGCQSRGFAINHDWRRCIFDDYACTLTLTAERFFEKLKILGVVR